MPPAVIGGNLAKPGRILGHLRRGPVKFQHQMRQQRHIRPGVAVKGPRGQRIDKFDTRDRDAIMNRVNNRSDGLVHPVKGAIAAETASGWP